MDSGVDVVGVGEVYLFVTTIMLPLTRSFTTESVSLNECGSRCTCGCGVATSRTGLVTSTVITGGGGYIGCRTVLRALISSIG